MKAKLKKWHILLMSFFALIITTITSLFILKADTIDEETGEILTDQWELYLSYYDSSVDNGKTALESIVWNASNQNDIKNLTIQLHYKNSNTQTEYAQNELKIIIPDFYRRFTMNNNSVSETDISIAADPSYVATKQYDWSYTYGYNSTLKEYVYTFSNNQPISINTNFEGTFQIVYSLSPSYGVTDNSFSLEAKLVNADVVSNSINFAFSSTETKYSLSKSISKLASLDGIPAGDYIWVKHSVSANATSDIRFLYKGSEYFTETIPEGCIVLNKQFELQEITDNLYTITTNISQSQYGGYSTETHIVSTEFYIGYPTETYLNKEITSTTTLYGYYSDKGRTPQYLKTEKTASEIKIIEKTFVLNDSFKFEYTGDLYSVSKGQAGSLDLELLKNEGDLITWWISGSAVYSGNLMTVRFGDDIVGYTTDNSTYQFLTDDQYCFLGLQFPTFKNKNNSYLGSKYELAVFVRYAHTNEYVKYGETLNTASYGVTFNETEKVVGWYVEIYDLEESIVLASYTNTASIQASMKINIDIDAENATFYNFDYIQAYIKDGQGNYILHNEPELSSYANITTKFNIATFDQATYGTYMQRSYSSITAKNATPSVEPIKTFTTTSKNVEKEQTEFYTQIVTEIDSDTVPRNFSGYVLYDLLPQGMNYNKDKEVTINITNTNCLKIMKSNGEKFTSSTEYLNYIQEHQTIEIIENYKGSGQTMIIIKVDFSDEPLNLAEIKHSLGGWDCQLATYKIPTYISDDDFIELGPKFTNYVYLGLIGHEFASYEWTNVVGNMVKDVGHFNPVLNDIDGDGNTTEAFVYDDATINVVSATNSHQDLTTFVQTTYNNFTTEIADQDCDSLYTYKLRVRTGYNAITNLVIYTNIEEAQPNRTRWKGTLESIDTSYAESQGYIIKVYYSTKENAKNLSEDNSWKEYNDSVDKSTIKSLAFQYLKENGSAAILPQGSRTYILINMTSPKDETITTLARMDCWTEWKAIDDTGIIIDKVVGINSNVVKVALPNSVKTDVLPSLSLRFTKEIDGTDSEFENMKLNKAAQQTFMIRLTSSTANEDGSYNQVTALLKSNQELIVSQIPIGTYLLEEFGDNYFDFVDFANNNDPEIIIEGVTFTQTEQGYIITVSENLTENIEFNIKVTNEIEAFRSYEDKDNKENLFLKNKIE